MVPPKSPLQDPGHDTYHTVGPWLLSNIYMTLDRIRSFWIVIGTSPKKIKSESLFFVLLTHNFIIFREG